MKRHAKKKGVVKIRKNAKRWAAAVMKKEWRTQRWLAVLRKKAQPEQK